MKRMLFVLALVAVCSLTASATQTVTLTSYCDVWNLHLDRGNNPSGALAPKAFVWGDHDLNQNGCTFGVFDTIGMKHGANRYVPPNDLFGTSAALYDISDTEAAPTPLEFTIRCKAGSSAIAVFLGGTSFGGHFFLNWDTATCSGKPAPQRAGLKPMVPRQ